MIIRMRSRQLSFTQITTAIVFSGKKESSVPFLFCNLSLDEERNFLNDFCMVLCFRILVLYFNPLPSPPRLRQMIFNFWITEWIGGGRVWVVSVSSWWLGWAIVLWLIAFSFIQASRGTFFSTISLRCLRSALRFTTSLAAFFHQLLCKAAYTSTQHHEQYCWFARHPGLYCVSCGFFFLLRRDYRWTFVWITSSSCISLEFIAFVFY